MSDMPSDAAALPETVCCPACRGPLAPDAPDGLRCTACGSVHPSSGGVPWLYRDVAGSRAQWAAKLQRFRDEILAELGVLERGAARAELLPSTRSRLDRARGGVERFGQQVFTLLEPFALAHSEAGALWPRDRIPSRQHLRSYLETVFRDWCWGEAELRETLEALEPLLEAGRVEAGRARHVVVLGGGAGRLAYELAGREGFASVVQIDLNPLLTRVATLVAAGERLTLTELPRLPHGLEHVAVDQTLERPDGDPPVPLHYLLGDVFAPPLAEGSVDVLVTPWLIDVLPESFRRVARRFGSLLAPGGRWIGFGPLSFESLPVIDRFTREEVEEALIDAGLRLEHSDIREVPYLHSPHGMTRRSEEILVFRATRLDAVSAPGEPACYPDWISDPSRSVPVWADLEQLRNERIFDAEILKCVDGRRSIDEIVEALADRYALPQDRCRNAVNGFFARVLEVELDPDRRSDDG